MTPEQLRALAEKALADVAALREEQSTGGVEAVNREIDTAYREIAGELQQVLTASERHYRAEKAKRLRAARTEAEDRPDPDGWFEREAERIDALVDTARRAYETEQGAQHDARFQSFRREKLRPQYAAFLAEQRNLPTKAIEKILQETNVDRMADRANELAAYRDAMLALKKKGDQQTKEQAAKRVSDGRIAAPATGRPRPPKVVPIRGEPDEWLEMIRQTGQ